MISTFMPTRMAFELSQLSQDATGDSGQAVKSTFKYVMGRAIPGFAAFQNRLFFTDGTPTLAQATAQATVSSATQYTLDSTFGARRLRRGQFVTPYDTTLTTPLTATRITWVDYKNRVVRMSGVVSSASNTDKLCFEGVSGASPVGMLGLYYWNSSATTGTTAGINRALEPELWANSVSGSGGLNYILGLNLFHQMLERRGTSSLDGMIGIAGLPQHAAAVGQVTNIQRIDIEGATAEMKDLLPKVQTEFPFAGVRHKVVPFQDATRLDWISPQETWGVARLHDVKYFEIGGQRFFPIYGAGGSPSAGLWFAMVANQNFFCSNPGANGYISALPVSAPYA